MRLEAVTVCVGYADFLREAIPYNLGSFDRWLIVTSPDDEETRELCRRYSLETLLTEEYRRDGDFGKGRIVERGMQQLSAGCWRLHLDADIVLPLRFRSLLEAAHLDPEKVYGCDRILVKSHEDWKRLQASGWLANQHDYHNRVTFPPGFAVGTRWASLSTGWVPIGFFQILHASAQEWRGVRIRPYPHLHGTACRTDVQFGLLWDRRNRELLPEILVAHLESEAAPLGANWNGRTTRRFGATRPLGGQSPHSAS